MYPNFNAEYARGNWTLEGLAKEMEKRGYSRTIGTLSQKLNGKYPITMNEAKLMRDIVAPKHTIDYLFEGV